MRKKEDRDIIEAKIEIIKLEIEGLELRVDWLRSNASCAVKGIVEEKILSTLENIEAFLDEEAHNLHGNTKLWEERRKGS